MFKFLQSFKGILIYIIVSVVLYISWIGIEYLLDGQIVSLHSDSVMFILLSFLLTDKIYDLF